MSLRAKTAKNIGIVAFLQVFATAINVLTFIILARLLTPFDFGIVAIASFVLGIIGQFSDFGLGPAVIQRQEDVEEALYTGGALRILIALFLFIMTFLLAPFASILFQSPEVTDVIRISALMFFLSSAGFVSTNRLVKELRFGKIAYVMVVISLTSAVFSIGFAWTLQSYWAMVFGPMIGSAFGLIALYLVCPWKARFRIDKKIAKELFEYGKHVFLMLFLVFLIFHLDDAFIAGVLGVVALGYYYVSYRWSSFIANFLTKLIYRVMFPTYAQMQEDRARLKKAYVETLNVISIMSFPLYLGLIMVAPDFIAILIGESWMPSVIALQILCVFGLLRTLTEPAGNVFLAIGKSKILSLTNLLNFVILTIFIYPATLWYGIEGVALLVVMMYLSHTMILWWFVKKELDIGFSQIGDATKTPFLSALLMFSFLLFSKTILGSGLFPFIAMIIIGGIVYSIAIYASEGERIRYYLAEIRRVLSSRQ